LLHNDDTLGTSYANDKGEYLKSYKFNICPENTISPGYVTEKLFQALQAGCVPIYSGPGPDPEPEVVNRDAVVFWRPGQDNSEAIRLVERLWRDEDEYRRFVERPALKPGAVDFVWGALRELRKRFEKTLAPRKA
jgi:hypothetical protein